MTLNAKSIFFGEFIGTLILVFFGCSSVAIATLFGGFASLFEVALFWVFAVFLGIICSQQYSFSHLNPAVSWGFFLKGEISFTLMIKKIIAQCLGAFCAAGLVFMFFEDAMLVFEASSNEPILHLKTASCFGEYFPNPGFQDKISLTSAKAMFMEGMGVFVLFYGIVEVVERDFNKASSALIISLIVGMLIVLIAPYTQAGFNPARDIMPRLFSYFTRWKDVAFSQGILNVLLVYVLAPFLGSSLAVFVRKFIPNRS